MQEQRNQLHELSTRDREDILKRACDRLYGSTDVRLNSSGPNGRRMIRAVLNLMDALEGVGAGDPVPLVETIKGAAEWCDDGIRSAADDLARSSPEDWCGPGEQPMPQESWNEQREDWKREIDRELLARQACDRALALLEDRG